MNEPAIRRRRRVQEGTELAEPARPDPSVAGLEELVGDIAELLLRQVTSAEAARVLRDKMARQIEEHARQVEKLLADRRNTIEVLGGLMARNAGR